MANPHLLQRLQGIQTILNGVHQGGGSMSASTRGIERQGFIDNFLSQVLPTPFRFGTGDATDRHGNRSGQLDVVVEVPLMPSLPLHTGGARLYLAEGVAAVIEVKSDVADQWPEVLHVAQQLSPLRRQFQTAMSVGFEPPERIPLFAVGYTGWKKLETLQEKLTDGPVEGILVVDSGLFASPKGRGVLAKGPWALWGLIASLTLLTSVPHISMPDPHVYATG
jgi:hypothetical protein